MGNYRTCRRGYWDSLTCLWGSFYTCAAIQGTPFRSHKAVRRMELEKAGEVSCGRVSPALWTEGQTSRKGK